MSARPGDLSPEAAGLLAKAGGLAAAAAELATLTDDLLDLTRQHAGLKRQGSRWVTTPGGWALPPTTPLRSMASTSQPEAERTVKRHDELRPVDAVSPPGHPSHPGQALEPGSLSHPAPDVRPRRVFPNQASEVNDG